MEAGFLLFKTEGSMNTLTKWARYNILGDSS